MCALDVSDEDVSSSAGATIVAFFVTSAGSDSGGADFQAGWQFTGVQWPVLD